MRRSALLLLALVPAVALASGNHFDRDAVVANSAVFKSLAETDGGGFAAVERSLLVTDTSLAALDLNLALTAGGAVDAAQHDLWAAKLDQRSGLFGDEYAALQEQLTRQSIAYEDAFEAALQRALATTPATECKAQAASPFDLTGPGGQRKETKTCPGEDVSATLAKAWDADAELKAAVDAIAAEAWPPITTYDGAEASMALAGAGPASSWIEPSELVENLPEAIEILDAIAETAAAERQRLIEIRNTLKEGDDATPIGHAARELREWTEAQKQALGGVLWEGLNRARKTKGKKEGWADAGACLNPGPWGGCDGTDVTDDVADVMIEDNRLEKDLAAFRDAIPAPKLSL